MDNNKIFRTQNMIEHLIPLMQAREERLKRWENEDEERKRIRNEELHKEYIAEAEIYKTTSLNNNEICHCNLFFDYTSYIIYLILLCREVINTNNTKLIDELKYKVKNLSTVPVYLGEHNADIETILLFIKFYPDNDDIHDFLSIIERARLQNRLPSIIPKILDSKITTTLDWINDIIYRQGIANYEYVVLKELLYKHGTPEIREILREKMLITNPNIHPEARGVINDYVNMKEEV